MIERVSLSKNVAPLVVSVGRSLVQRIGTRDSIAVRVSTKVPGLIPLVTVLCDIMLCVASDDRRKASLIFSSDVLAVAKVIPANLAVFIRDLGLTI